MYHGDQFVLHINVKSLCCPPETNKMLYVNYTSVKRGDSTTAVENSTDVPQKLKNRTTVWSSHSTSEFIAKELKAGSHRNICTPCSQQHYSQPPKAEATQVSVDWWTKYSIYVRWNSNFISFLKWEGSSVTCYNMDEAWGHYAKWGKSGTKR